MHSRLSFLPAPYTRAGRVLSDLRRLIGTGAALFALALARLLYWTGCALGAVSALVAVVLLLAFGAAFLALCAAAGICVWGVLALSPKTGAFARLLASWAAI